MSDFDPHSLAVLYYFGDLGYRKLPSVAADALEHGFDGQALRRLAGITNSVESEIQTAEVDSAFREMGVTAPITRAEARLTLAAESARNAIIGSSNVFDEATHIRIHLCGVGEPPAELRKIANLSKQAHNAPRSEWKRLEFQLRDAMWEFVNNCK